MARKSKRSKRVAIPYVSPLSIIKATIERAQKTQSIALDRFGMTSNPLLPMALRPRLDLKARRAKWRVENIGHCVRRQYFESEEYSLSGQDLMLETAKQFYCSMICWWLQISAKMDFKIRLNHKGRVIQTKLFEISDVNQRVSFDWTLRETTIDGRMGTYESDIGFTTILVEPIQDAQYQEFFTTIGKDRQAQLLAKLQTMFPGIYARTQFSLGFTKDFRASVIFINLNTQDMGEVIVPADPTRFSWLVKRTEHVQQCLAIKRVPKLWFKAGTQKECEECLNADQCKSIEAQHKEKVALTKETGVITPALMA
jgi:hypothetical protein